MGRNHLIVMSHTVGLAICALLTSAACSTGSDAVDPTSGGDYRYVGVTPAGKTIPVADRKHAGRLTAPYLSQRGRFVLSSLRGHVVVLSFWAEWCTPCKAEAPGLEEMYDAMKTRAVAFIGITVKTSSKDQARNFVRNYHLTYPILWDEIGRTAIELGNVPMFTLPSSVVIDRQGRVAAVYLGIVQRGDLQPVLAQLSRR